VKVAHECLDECTFRMTRIAVFYGVSHPDWRKEMILSATTTLADKSAPPTQDLQLNDP
jgi:hypothetical protein